MTRSTRTSDRLERAARRVFRPLCGSLVVFVLLSVADAHKTNPTLHGAAKWTTGGLLAAWFLLGAGSALTEPGGRS